MLRVTLVTTSVTNDFELRLVYFFFFKYANLFCVRQEDGSNKFITLQYTE